MQGGSERPLLLQFGMLEAVDTTVDSRVKGRNLRRWFVSKVVEVPRLYIGIIWVVGAAGGWASAASSYAAVDWGALTEILGPGRYARIVWSRPVGTSLHVFLADTKTATVTQLTHDSLFPGTRAWLESPTLTLRGDRVIFYNRADYTTYVINIDGSGLRSLAQGFMTGEPWQEPNDRSDWVLMYSVFSHTVGPVYRYQIDGDVWIMVADSRDVNSKYFNHPFGSLNSDGSLFAAAFPSPKKMLRRTISPYPVVRTLRDGCWVSISHEQPNEIVHIVDHRVLTIEDLNGTVLEDTLVRDYFLDKPIDKRAWEYTAIRWSNRNDYLTLCVKKDSWKESCGVALVSRAKRKFAVIDTVNTTAHAYVYENEPPLPAFFTNLPDTIKVPARTPQSFLFSCYPQPSDFKALAGGSVWTCTGKTHMTGGIYTLALPSLVAGTYPVTVACDIPSYQKDIMVIAADDSLLPSCHLDSVVETHVTDYAFKLRAELPPPSKTWIPLIPLWEYLTGPGGVLLYGNKSVASHVTMRQVAADADHVIRFLLRCGTDILCDTIRLHVNRYVTPQFLQPRNGDTVIAGSFLIVSWIVEPPIPVTLTLSVDGIVWENLTETRAVGGSSTSEKWGWHIPDTLPAGTYFLRVSSYGNDSTLAVTTIVVRNGGIGTILFPDMPHQPAETGISPMVSSSKSATEKLISLRGQQMPFPHLRPISAGVYLNTETQNSAVKIAR